jgi:hypothetical protein
MAFFTSRFAAATALAASLAMAASPVAAAQLPHGGGVKAPVPAAKSWSVESETAQRHRGYRGGGWGGGYGRGWGGHRHHHGDGIDGGDVLAGILILGGIAAIASAASNNSRDREDEPYREPDVRYRDGDSRSPGYDGSGLDNAADMCVREVERSEQVNSVESVERIASGWQVEGRLGNGRNFSCNIDNSGKVSRVELDDKVSANSPQWNDDAYARARAARDAQSGDDEDSQPGG